MAAAAEQRPEQRPEQPLTVSRLLREYTAGYVAQHRQQAAPQVQSTLAKLALCRTAAMVLHTWNQKLESRAHVHALVPGGGPALTGNRGWKISRRPFVKKCDGNYLTPEHVVKYLARYLTGGPISDRRLMSHEHGEVTFFARVGKKTGGDEKTEPIALPGVEFVRRWSLHILPKGYTKTRRFGGFSNRHCQRYIAECRDLLTTGGIAAIPCVAAALALPAVPNSDEPTKLDRRAPSCPTCKARMRCIAAEHRRSWKIVMRSHYRPTWYSDG